MSRIFSNWKDVPINLKTENSLIKMGIYKKGKVEAICQINGIMYKLYDLNTALDLEKKSGNKTLTINTENKNDFLIMEIATTGRTSSDEIIQLVLLNMDGQLLMNQYFKPNVEISKEEMMKHNINKFYLKQMPKWNEKWGEIRSYIQNKILLIPNTSHGKRLFEQTCSKYNVEIDCNINFIYSRESIQHKFSLLSIFKSSEISGQNPLKDSFETLKMLYPKSPVYEVQEKARKYFSLLCDYKIKNGEQNAYEIGYKWLQNEFGVSSEELDFDNMNADVCHKVINSLDLPLKGLGLLR